MLLRKHVYLAVVVFTALVMIGCGIPPGKIVYDQNLPPERTVQVVFADTIQVKQYNGIDVWETWYPKGKPRKNTVTLPVGSTSIGFDVAASISQGNVTTHFTAKDLELRFDFEAGKKYTVGVYTERMGLQTFFLGKLKVGIAVWDYLSPTGNPGGKERAIKYWELGEI